VARLKSPAGLDIKAIHPPEIALSVLAENRPVAECRRGSEPPANGILIADANRIGLRHGSRPEFAAGDQTPYPAEEGAVEDMDISDEVRIAAPKQAVYDALNDPEILRQCIPGCEEFTQRSPTELEAKVLLKIGPVKARFAGNVELDPSGAPDAFSLLGRGKGGAAGFAKGGADVTLEDDDGGTILRYEAKAEIGGKIAQLGSRLVRGTAKKLSGEFFSRFAKVVGDGDSA